MLPSPALESAAQGGAPAGCRGMPPSRREGGMIPGSATAPSSPGGAAPSGPTVLGLSAAPPSGGTVAPGGSSTAASSPGDPEVVAAAQPRPRSNAARTSVLT